jgi:gluconolactonase
MAGLDVQRVDVIAAGMRWAEGPAAFGGGVLFSDIPNDVIHLWRNGAVEHFRRPSNQANGNTTDELGRLITCEHLSRSVTRTEADGTLTVLATHWQGKRLNSPNDVAVAPDGGIWFTDPPYMALNGGAPPGYLTEIDFAGVFRIDPASGSVDLMIDILDKPNGLAFGNDGRQLYVSDTGYSHRAGGNHHVFRFELRDGKPRDMSVFATISPGACDGLRIDAAGYVWVTSGEGVQCLSPDAHLVGRIDVGEMGTNLCLLNRDTPSIFLTTPTRAIVVSLGGVTNPAGFARPSR